MSVNLVKRVKIGSNWFVPENPNLEIGQTHLQEMRDYQKNYDELCYKDNKLPLVGGFFRSAFKTHNAVVDSEIQSWVPGEFELVDVVRTENFVKLLMLYLKERDDFKEWFLNDMQRANKAETALGRTIAEKDAALKYLEDRLNKIKDTIMSEGK